MTAAGLPQGRKAEWKDTEPLDGEAVPALWNPAAAASWSLVFTPVFGAALHMHNWRVLGDEEKAAQAKGWMLVSIAVFVVTLVASVVLPDSRQFDRIERSVGMGLLFAWYFTAARVQQKYVKEQFGKDYPRKGWGKPIGTALLVLLGVFCVLFVIALVKGK